MTKDCDYVHHVAAPISLDVPKDPDAFIPAAVDGTLRVLNAASKNNKKSSSDIYIRCGHLW